jgi:hypothetical protein
MRIQKFKQFEKASKEDPDLEELDDQFDDLELDWDMEVTTLDYINYIGVKYFLVHISISEKMSIKNIISLISSRIKRIEEMTDFTLSNFERGSKEYPWNRSGGEGSFGKIFSTWLRSGQKIEDFINKIFFDDVDSWMLNCLGSRMDVDRYDSNIQVTGIILNFQKIPGVRIARSWPKMSESRGFTKI